MYLKDFYLRNKRSQELWCNFTLSKINMFTLVAGWQHLKSAGYEDRF